MESVSMVQRITSLTLLCKNPVL